jgi:hypothetical protein
MTKSLFFSKFDYDLKTNNDPGREASNSLSLHIYETGLQQYWKVKDKVKKDMKMAKMQGENDLDLVKLQHLREIFMVFGQLLIFSAIVFLAEILRVFFANQAEQSVFFEFFAGCSVHLITVRRMLKNLMFK